MWCERNLYDSQTFLENTPMLAKWKTSILTNNVFIWNKERCFIVINTYRVFLHDPRGSGTRANRRFGLTAVFSSFRSIRAVSLLIVLCNGPAACAPSPLLIGAGLWCRRLCAVNASVVDQEALNAICSWRTSSFILLFLFYRSLWVNW